MQLPFFPPSMGRTKASLDPEPLELVGDPGEVPGVRVAVGPGELGLVVDAVPDHPDPRGGPQRDRFGDLKCEPALERHLKDHKSERGHAGAAGPGRSGCERERGRARGSGGTEEQGRQYCERAPHPRQAGWGY